MPRNFEILGNIPTNSAANELRYNPAWASWTKRQTFPNSPHHMTQCIRLRAAMLDHEFVALDAERINSFREELPSTWEVTHAALRKLGHTDYSRVGNILVALLPVESAIDPHPDEGPYAEAYRRSHLVIDAVPTRDIFIVDGKEYRPRPGDLFTFNHRVVHSARNDSIIADRVHLIIDHKE